MTAIAGLVWRGRVYLAGDAMISEGEEGSADRVSYSRSPKVWLTTAGHVVGAAGSLPYLAALGRVQWPERVEESWPRIREALQAAGVDGDEGEALIGTRGRTGRGELWSATSALLPLAGPYAGAGTGAPYVLGSLSSSVGAPASRVREAIRVAARWCSSVGGPITVVHCSS